MKPKIIAIIGPTSSGKSALALELAEMLDGEIVNADARQIYRGFDIGSGKPSPSDQARVPHYLYDWLAPEETTSVADWLDQVMTEIRAIVGRGKLPIVVGGTGLYVQALVDGYAIPRLPPQTAWRERMALLSNEELIARLEAHDPAAVARIDTRNPRRVLRALECALFGNSDKRQERAEPLVHALTLALRIEREDLRVRITQAIDRRFEQGWIEEVRGLLAQGLTTNVPAMTAIGYRDIVEYLSGARSFADMRERIIHATWHYAKRQLTWCRRMKDIVWIEDSHQALEQARLFLRLDNALNTR